MNSAQFEISIQVPEEPHRQLVVGPGCYLIGRDAACQIHLDFLEVSFHHARLTLQNDAAWIEDLGSSNGVVVDGRRIESRFRFSLPGKIHLGGARLEIHLGAGNGSELAGLVKESQPQRGLPFEGLRERRYKVGELLAQGGMGAILQAQDLNLRRTVAMKVVLPDKRASPESLSRFVQEAQVMGQLEHPNIVPLHELALNAQGEVFYTMKLIKGRTLGQLLEQIHHSDQATLAAYPLAQLLTVFQKVCDAIAFAHSKGVIHRDLKPENIMIGEYGEVLVMDWGLAKLRSEQRISIGLQSSGFADCPVRASGPMPTLEGRIMGTPHYMSPEQAKGTVLEIDERTDIFALGGILYHLLTFRPPVTGSTLHEVLGKINAGLIKPPVAFNRGPGQLNQPPEMESARSVCFPHCPGGRIPEALSAVAMKALSIDPLQRYQTVQMLQEDLAAYQQGFATSAENAGFWKLMNLAIKRRKTEVTLVAASLSIIFFLAAGFLWKMNRTLAELRRAAPSFYAEAQQLVEEGKLKPALQRITYALSLIPGDVNFYCLKGNIHQSLLQFELARDDYLQALKSDPDRMVAAESLALCQKILQRTAATNALDIETLQELRLTMLRQQRFAEALAISARIGKADQQFLDQWRSLLNKAGVSGLLTKDPDGVLRLGLKQSPIRDLTPLRGLPLTSLDLTGCTNISDLKPLQGLPLRDLRLENCSVSDLSPITGMPLISLWLNGTRVTEISALRGMHLQQLVLGNTKVNDISALQGMPLGDLNLGWTRVKDISALHGMAIGWLNLSGTPVSDLTPLQGTPLGCLLLDQCPNLQDLTPLAECKALDTLTIPEHVKNIEFLRRLPAIKKLGYTVPRLGSDLIQPATEFWREYDARK